MKIYKVLKTKSIQYAGRFFEIKKGTIQDENIITKLFPEYFQEIGTKVYSAEAFRLPVTTIFEEKTTVLDKEFSDIVESAVNKEVEDDEENIVAAQINISKVKNAKKSNWIWFIWDSCSERRVWQTA